MVKPSLPMLIGKSKAMELLMTADVIDANELVIDIYIKPVRTAEFILVNFRATRTSANFQEILR